MENEIIVKFSVLHKWIMFIRFLSLNLQGEDIETQKAVATGETLVIPCGIVIRYDVLLMLHSVLTVAMYDMMFA